MKERAIISYHIGGGVKIVKNNNETHLIFKTIQEYSKNIF